MSVSINTAGMKSPDVPESCAGRDKYGCTNPPTMILGVSLEHVCAECKCRPEWKNSFIAVEIES